MIDHSQKYSQQHMGVRKNYGGDKSSDKVKYYYDVCNNEVEHACGHSTYTTD